MRQLFRCLFLFFAFLLFCPAFVSALDIPKQPEGYVSDYANLLSDSTRSQLEQSLKDFEEKTGNQVLVATFPGLQGDSLESYSIRLAEAWKPGQKRKDNGVILLIFKEDRKGRIEVGYGLEGVLTDALCKLIIENEIAPRFRAGDYDGGIEQAVQAIFSATRGEYRQAKRSSRVHGVFWNFGTLLLVFISFLPTVVLWFLSIVGILGTASSLFFGWPPLFVGLGIFVVGLLGFIMQFLAARSNSSGLSGRGYYRGYGGSFSGGWGGGFGGGGFSGGGGGFGGGGSSGSW